MKAAQAISSEIELEQLLSSLMQILIENAGAQTGCLLLENSGEWAIEAACELNEGEKVCATQVLRSIPTTRLPETIVQYVIRTHESVILNDATREGNFINDPYIQKNQTQSLLCLPLLNQSKLVGVLYLENQLAAGAFTPERSQILSLLSTQAAIAIENAKLYSVIRASESRLAQFLEAVPVGIAVFDAVGRPHYFNQRAVQLLGKDSDPSVSLDHLVEAYQVYLAGTDQPYPTEALPSIRALSGERSTVDDIEIHQNDKTVPVEAWGTPVFDEQGNVSYAIAAFQDITKRKQAEQVLADYNCTLEQQVTERTADLLHERKRAEEASILEERNRMAREIHDTLAQSFTGIIIHARSAASKIAIDPDKAQAYLAEVQDLARTGLTEARRSVEALRRPSLLENNDLLGAFKQLITQLESSTDTIMTCEAIGTSYALPSEVENNLLRIGQEALTNALRYAEATEIRVELIYQPTQCILQIKDDGQGFTVDPASSCHGFGLLGMTERAKRIDAQIRIQSTPGQGTEIVVFVDQEKTS
jgi:signal transduction histidine kinase